MQASAKTIDLSAEAKQASAWAIEPSATVLQPSAAAIQVCMTTMRASKAMCEASQRCEASPMARWGVMLPARRESTLYRWLIANATFRTTAIHSERKPAGAFAARQPREFCEQLASLKTATERDNEQCNQGPYEPSWRNSWIERRTPVRLGQQGRDCIERVSKKTRKQITTDRGGN